MKLNKTWHLENKMPKNPTLEERIKWHEGHEKNCSCRDSRPMLAKLKTGQRNLRIEKNERR